MLNQLFKITVCCVFAWSLSSKGEASPIQENLLELPHSSLPPTPSSDLELTHPSSDQASSSSTPFIEESITTEESTDAPSSSSSSNSIKRKIKRVKSVKSSKGYTTKKQAGEKTGEDLLSNPDLSKDMAIEPSSDKARMMAAWAAYLLPTTVKAKSPTLFAPQELLPVHILLALRANEEIKGKNGIRPIIYLPSLKMFIGYKEMLYGKESDLKEALKYHEFQEVRNLTNAILLLCIWTEEDLKKITNQQDMKIAEELITETQKEQWYQTHIKVRRSDTDKRVDPNTLALIKRDEIQNTESNLATYVLMSHDKLFKPEEKTDNSSKKLKKGSNKHKVEETEYYGIQFLLSVTRLKEVVKTSSKRKKSEAKRSESINVKDTSIASPSTPISAPEESQPIMNSQSKDVSSRRSDSESNELMTKPTSSSMEKGE